MLLLLTNCNVFETNEYIVDCNLLSIKLIDCTSKTNKLKKIEKNEKTSTKRFAELVLMQKKNEKITRRKINEQRHFVTTMKAFVAAFL